MKKIETSVTLERGGMHKASEYRKAVKMIRGNTYKRARLYHFVLKGSPTPTDYNRAAEGIVKLLRSKGIDCTGKACWERNARHGLHFHFFVLLEASHGRVDHWLNPAEDGPLKTMLAGFGIKVHIAPPRNEMHRQSDGTFPLYQYVSKSGPKLEDAVIRISYLYKNDTKDNTMTRIYYSTRNRAAAPAATNEQEETMPLPTLPLSPVGFAYLGDIYESAVDAGLNLTEIQAHLSKRGIHKGLLAIRYDLDFVFSFTGYAASHPAPAYQTLAEIDAVLRQRQPARLIEKALVATSKRSYNGRNDTHTTGH
jgi:hypothetical protein